jgi:hypothetical protein
MFVGREKMQKIGKTIENKKKEEQRAFKNAVVSNCLFPLFGRRGIWPEIGRKMCLLPSPIVFVCRQLGFDWPHPNRPTILPLIPPFGRHRSRRRKMRGPTIHPPNPIQSIRPVPSLPRLDDPQGANSMHPIQPPFGALLPKSKGRKSGQI